MIASAPPPRLEFLFRPPIGSASVWRRGHCSGPPFVHHGWAWSSFASLSRNQIKRHSQKIVGMLHGYDRLFFRGSLRSISYFEGLENFLGANHVRYLQFEAYAQTLTHRLKAHLRIKTRSGTNAKRICPRLSASNLRASALNHNISKARSHRIEQTTAFQLYLPDSTRQAELFPSAAAARHWVDGSGRRLADAKWLRVTPAPSECGSWQDPDRLP